MTYRCPACARSFGEPGFCPYDGKPLGELDIASKPTIVSEMLPAQSGPYTITDPDSQLPANTDPEIMEPTGHKIRAISAHASPTQVGDALRNGPAETEYDRLVGETLDGRYYVQRKIGEGGMGVVFAAKHAVIERPLAIKVLKREVMRDTATIKRFVQEAKAASRIGHPNIVDVTDFGTTPDGMTYSVMEYVDGKTLAASLKASSPFPPERAIRVATQIARALAAAHDKGIVHRDLKPENVFLIDRDDRPDFVKIVDFGIAKVQPLEGAANEPRLTRAGSVFGTPEYMAPEQAAGRNDTDHRVDIYALGTILYEMVVGRTPHRSNSTVRTIAMQMLDPITPPSQVHPDLFIPKPLELAIMKALAKKREERFQTMAELIAALDDVTLSIERNAAGPTRSLAPLPPGADPTTTPSLPPARIRSSDAPANVPMPVPARRQKPTTRQVHEPAFATRGAVVLPVIEESEPPPTARRWPYALIVVVLLVGGASALFFAMRGGARDEHVAGRDDAGAGRGDTAVIAEVSDVGVDEPVRDAKLIAEVPVDGGTAAKRDGGGLGVAPHPKTITVEVLTRPGEADVFVGHTFRGPSGVRLTERYGTKLDLECRAAHYKGKITVVFDGSRDSVMCTAMRLPFCVEGLKNPIDECEDRTP